MQCFDFKRLTSKEIDVILQENNLALTHDEIHKIQDLLERPPTLTECILWSIQGSEHCSYKSTRPLLKQLPTDGPNVILGAKEDAGVVRIATDKQGDSYGIVISHESHNHPSQIVPYEGAATGIGGNVRDVCCMGARVIALADSLRFGDIDNHRTHWTHHGVVDGIAGYGNPLGVPNLAGDLYYDASYQQNCLVTVVTLGLVKENDIIHSYAPKNADGYDLILVGKPTDNSGFGGASFASLELDEDKHEQNRGAVQEPNAFLGRHLLAANYALFDILKEKNLIDQVGFKDLGAGGVACAGVEIADSAGYGACIDLTKIHTAEKGLHPAVILCAETQERYMWAVPPELTELVLNHYNQTYDLPKVSAGARASVVGKITNEPQFIVRNGDETLVDAKAEDITRGIVYERAYQIKEKNLVEPTLPEENLNDTLLALLAHENIASRKAVFENYDKQVQGRTVLERGQASSGVMQPFNNNDYPKEIQQVGIALSVSHNPRYGKIDAYWTAVNAVCDSMRKVAATGAAPQTITDCLCFGNPEKPEQMAELVSAIEGIKDSLHGAGLKFDKQSATPVVAGNVSLYNESAGKPIPASPVISCLGKLDNVDHATSSSLKKQDSLLVMVGERKDECGGSAYYAYHQQLGANIPKPDFQETANQIYAVTDAIEKDLVLTARHIADGGVAVALTEMSFENEVGFDVMIPGKLNLNKLLFSETGGFVLEIDADNLDAVTDIFKTYGQTIEVLGKTNTSSTLSFNNTIQLKLQEAKAAWAQGLRKKLG